MGLLRLTFDPVYFNNIFIQTRSLDMLSVLSLTGTTSKLPNLTCVRHKSSLQQLSAVIYLFNCFSVQVTALYNGHSNLRASSLLIDRTIEDCGLICSYHMMQNAVSHDTLTWQVKGYFLKS